MTSIQHLHQKSLQNPLLRGLLQIVLILVFLVLVGCKKNNVETQIGRAWVVKEAFHINKNGGRVKVYTRGQTGNLFNYDPFVLDLSSSALQFTDIAQGGERFDFTGKWRIDQKVRLVLFDLSPEPTCEDGVSCIKDGIQFFIDNASSSELKINRLYQSDKTGDTVNEYVLQPKN